MSDPQGALADGSAPHTPADLLGRLKNLGLRVRTMEHPAVYTVEEAKRLRGEIGGCHTKNLFLRNKKGAMWLLVCLEDRELDLSALGRRVGAGRFSLGSAQRLMRYLGVIPGAVTPFAVMNDGGKQVQVLLDRAVVGCETLNFHPLDNTMTTSISAPDFLRFLEAEGHPPEIIDLD